MIKKLLISLVLLWCIIFGGYFFISRYYNNVIAKPLSFNENVTQFNVKSGDTLYNVLSRLNQEGKLKNEFLTKYYIKTNKISLNLKPGNAILEKDMSMEEFLLSLENVKAEEDVNSVKVTIPEGYTVEDIAALFEEKKIIKKEAFLKAVKEYPLPDYVKSNKDKKHNLEGYLYPETYIIKKDEKPEEIIKLLISSFEKTFYQIQKTTGKDIKTEDIEEIIIKAAMVEKEARADEDRPKIASVISNRLKKKMQLQLDATVLYALGEHKEVINLNDLKVASPFNTYYVKALPIGAICNPGKESIESVLNPSQTDYLYYILSKDNKTHYFTNDYNDFLRKKKEFSN